MTLNLPSTIHPLALDDRALLRQCEVDTFRSSGPGGQKRNKTSSGVRLRHQPTGVMVTATEDRSQHVNKARAIRRLRAAIAIAVRRSLAEDYEPSALVKAYFHDPTSLALKRKDPRLPLIVAEVLDALMVSGCKLSDASKVLGTHSSSLVSLFQSDPRLWQHVNQMRAAARLKPLK